MSVEKSYFCPISLKGVLKFQRIARKGNRSLEKKPSVHLRDSRRAPEKGSSTGGASSGTCHVPSPGASPQAVPFPLCRWITEAQGGDSPTSLGSFKGEQGSPQLPGCTVCVEACVLPPCAPPLTPPPLSPPHLPPPLLNAGGVPDIQWKLFPNGT